MNCVLLFGFDGLSLLYLVLIVRVRGINVQFFSYAICELLFRVLLYSFDAFVALFCGVLSFVSVFS